MRILYPEEPNLPDQISMLDKDEAILAEAVLKQINEEFPPRGRPLKLTTNTLIYLGDIDNIDFG